MTALPRDIHNRSIPAFFNVVGGAGDLPVNNDGPTNTPVYADLLTAAPTLPSVPMIVQVSCDIACRIALVEAGNTDFAVAADMADEWVLLPDTYLPLPALYPSRARLYVCALDSAESGTLRISGSTQGVTNGTVPALGANVLVWNDEVLHFDHEQLVFTP